MSKRKKPNCRETGNPRGAMINLFAGDIWHNFILRHLVVGNRATPETLAAFVLARLHDARLYQRMLLAPMRHPESTAGGSARDRRQEHLHAEMIAFTDALMRPVMVSNRAPAGLTSTHQLLQAVLRFTPDAAWGRLRLDRRLDPVIKSPDPATALGRFAQAMRRLVLAEQRVGFRPGSVSPHWIDQAGPVCLTLDGLSVPVPEELSLPDLLESLPERLDDRLIAEYEAGQAMIADEMGARADRGGDAEPRQLHWQATRALRDRGLPGGYRLWLDVARVIETLNEGYGKIVVRSGLPAEIATRLSHTQVDLLTRLRERAGALAKADQGRATWRDFEAAWRELAPGGQLGPYRSFDAFLRSREGQWLVHSRAAVLGCDRGGSDPDAAPVRELGAAGLTGSAVGDTPDLEADGDAAAGRELVANLDLWRGRGLLTRAEARGIGWCLGAWEPPQGRRRTTAFDDPAFAGALADTLAGEYPYRLISDPARRFRVYAFFLKRRVAMLVRNVAAAELVTGGEQNALDHLRRSAREGRSRAETFAWLRADRAFARTLDREAPFAWVGDLDARWAVFTFFFNRDVQSIP